jgi:hypothetical protein
MYNTASTIEVLSVIAQYFIVLKAFMASGENIVFLETYPSNLNA